MNSPIGTKNRHSDWRYVRVDPDRVFIEDLDLGRMSVTNDAENVVRSVNNDYPRRRIIYKDSSGQWDELVHEGGKFTRFSVYKEYLP